MCICEHAQIYKHTHTYDIQGTKFIALADYNAMGSSEVSMKEGAEVVLLKVGCAGWVLVKKLGRFYG